MVILSFMIGSFFSKNFVKHYFFSACFICKA